MQEQLQTLSSNAQKRLGYFVAGLLLLPIVVSIISLIARFLSIPTLPLTVLYHGALWLLALSSLPCAKSVWPRFAVVYGLFIFVGIIETAFYSGTQYYVSGTDFDSILKFQPDTFLATSFFMLVGMCFSDFGELLRIFHKAARIGVVLSGFVYLLNILGGSLNHYDDMNYAYAICTVLCILIADTQKHDIWFILIGAVCMIIAGTRGPIVCCLLAVIIKVLLVETDAKKIAVRLLGFGLCAVAVQFNVLYYILNAVASVLRRFGIRQIRLLEYANSGILLDSSGRDSFASTVWDAVKENPIFGYGLGGDRQILGGRYVHNLFFELLVSFGVVIGSIIFIWLLVKCIRALRCKDLARKKVVLAFFCFAFLKLMFSSSMLYSKELFILIGILLVTPKSPALSSEEQKVQAA